MLIPNTWSPLGASTLVSLIINRKSRNILYWHLKTNEIFSCSIPVCIRKNPFLSHLFLVIFSTSFKTSVTTCMIYTICKLGYLKLKTQPCLGFSWEEKFDFVNAAWWWMVGWGPLNLKPASFSKGTQGQCQGRSFVLAGPGPCEAKKSS